MRGTFLALAAAALLFAAASPALAQAMIHVAVTGTDSATCGSASSPCKTIQAGIDLAAAGDTVVVGSGTYKECIVVTPGAGTGGVVLTTESYQSSSTVGAAVLDGTGVCDAASTPGPVAVVTDGSSISGFLIEHGGNSGVWGLGAVEIVHNAITANQTATVGGGIYLVTGSYLADPMATAVISGNTITTNTAAQDGGGIYVDATGDGVPSVVTIDGNTVTNNTAGGAVGAYGGGIAAFTDTIAPADTSSVTLTNNTLVGNKAKNATDGSAVAFGGGVFVATGATSGLGAETITVGGSGAKNTLRSNVSEGFGGGISANLQPGSGGRHTVAVDANAVTHNTAEGGGGGGIHAFAIGSDLDASTTGSLAVRNNAIKGNESTPTVDDPNAFGGGGLFAETYAFRTPSGAVALDLSGNDIETNTAPAVGGGASLLAYATDDPNGDGVTAAASATIAFHNNLVAGNQALEGVAQNGRGRGGGVYAYAEAQGGLASASVDHDFLTVAENATDTGAGGLEWDAAATADSVSTTGQVLVTLTNSIVTVNEGVGTGGGILPGAGVSVDIRYDDAFHNVAGDWDAQLGVEAGVNGILDVDPALDDVFVSTPCSPTVDAGDPASGTLGEPPPNGNRVNLGHLGGTAGATATYPDINGDGSVDGLDVLAIAVGFNASTGDGRFNAAADIDFDGIVDGQDLAYVAAYYALSCP